MIDNDDAWHHEQQLERRRKEEKDCSVEPLFSKPSPMDDREKIERLNQAIAILKPIDNASMFTVETYYTLPRITHAIRSLENLISALKKKIK